MVYSSVLAAAFAVLLASSGVAFAEEKIGAGIALKEATPIATLLETPDKYEGKTVRIDGQVAAVCDGNGCWMQLKDEKSGKSLFCKVDDGVLVFPTSARGKKASAEGVFEKVPGAKPDANGKTPYHVKTTGAVVY
jgi:hypothetical protein